MNHAVLTRGGAIGKMRVGPLSWWTIEREWKNNESNVSCIPVGVYHGVMTFSPRFKQFLYELVDVPDRFAVRVHPANLASQLNGCIALGKSYGTMGGKPAVLLSRPAVREFEAALQRKPFTLEVR